MTIEELKRKMKDALTELAIAEAVVRATRKTLRLAIKALSKALSEQGKDGEGK